MKNHTLHSLLARIFLILSIASCGTVNQAVEKQSETLIDASDKAEAQKKEVLQRVCEIVVNGVESAFDIADAVEKAARDRIQNVFKNNLSAAEKSDCKK